MKGRPSLVLLGVLYMLGLGGLCVRVWQSADQVTPSVRSQCMLLWGVCIDSWGGGRPILSSETSS